MASGVSLAVLRTRLRRLCDIEGSTARFPDAELNDYINRSIDEVYDVIRSAFGDDYYRSSYSFTTVNGTALYSLPGDFLSLISVDAYVTGTTVVSCRKYTEDQRNRYRWLPVGWTLGQPVYYRLQASNISFIPSPPGVYSITLNYVPVAPNLVSDGDTFDGVNGWDEYVLYSAACMVALKDENYDQNGIFDQKKMAMKVRIDAMAPERDAGQGERVHDVYVGDDWWG